MHRRFTRTMDIQTGVVLGDLERARAAGDWLTRYAGDESFPPKTDDFQTNMRGNAALIAQAPNLETVAAHAGQMAAACGSCHEALSGGPHFVVGSNPGSGGSTANHMIRHLWAVDRMWEGLVGPSEDAWRAGAEALLLGWDPTGEAVQRSGSAERARSLLDQVGRLGAEAAGASTQEARASLLGEILTVCHSCHQAVSH